ncbi:GDSL-type esterase/lipase family protein [Botrimarina sp.]|uniref:GDSL-type esterase/lipase family protein n=1 Tax=Botrimarina sp. TaxID=2795802 RepID=UPI0032EB87BA
MRNLSLLPSFSAGAASARRLAPPLAAALIAGLLVNAEGSAAYWTEPMQAVHANFTGRAGTIARFGDSISVSGAYFGPLRYRHSNTTADSQAALAWLQGRTPADVWNWQSAATGAKSGSTSAWPLEPSGEPGRRNVDVWLDTLNPEIALVMWGTNDLARGAEPADYAANLREVVAAIKSNGTTPILISPPPRSGYEAAAQRYSEALADLALEEGVPLVDYHGEILARAPGDQWNGALIYDGAGSVYDVERLVSGDGVHPSNPSGYRSNFSDAALGKSGYTLLNYAVLGAAHDLYQQALSPAAAFTPADFNGDGSVDAADYTVWRDSLGLTDLTPYQLGDANGDRQVTNTDYQAWAASYQSPADAAAPSPTPEPAASTLLLLLAAPAACRSGRRRVVAARAAPPFVPGLLRGSRPARAANSRPGRARGGDNRPVLDRCAARGITLQRGAV